MKKIIALGGAALCLSLFAWQPIAHADDDMSSDSSNTEQEAGTAGSDSSMSSETSKSMETEKKQDWWKSAKSCTDESGKVYKKGSKGFSTCMETMRKKEQMGGMAPGESQPTMKKESTTEKKETTTESSMDTPHSDSSDSSNR